MAGDGAAEVRAGESAVTGAAARGSTKGAGVPGEAASASAGGPAPGDAPVSASASTSGPVPGSGSSSTAAAYRSFAEHQARPSSPRYAEWASGVADDAEVLALVDGLRPERRQPNLVLACARLLGAPDAPWRTFRAWLVDHWGDVAAQARVRTTQTNEPGRCAVLVPELARLPAPLALVEVGASAGLCLLPDRWSYEYTDGRDVVRLDPVRGGPSRVVLRCRVDDLAVVPERLPHVVWRAGVDLHPLDVTVEDDVRWLRTLVWPGEDERLARLDAAIATAAADPPRVLVGDLLRLLPDLVAQRPHGAHLVVMHSAVLVYLSEAERRAFVELVRELDVTWLSNEGAGVLPDVAARLPADVVPDGAFVLARDGEPVALTHPHGAWLRTVGDGPV